MLPLEGFPSRDQRSFEMCTDHFLGGKNGHCLHAAEILMQPSMFILVLRCKKFHGPGHAPRRHRADHLPLIRLLDLALHVRLEIPEMVFEMMNGVAVDFFVTLPKLIRATQTSPFQQATHGGFGEFGRRTASRGAMHMAPCSSFGSGHPSGRDSFLPSIASFFRCLLDPSSSFVGVTNRLFPTPTMPHFRDSRRAKERNLDFTKRKTISKRRIALKWQAQWNASQEQRYYLLSHL